MKIVILLIGIMIITHIGCGASWEKYDNDYALVIDVYENYYKFEKIDHYHPQTEFDKYFVLKEENKALTLEQMGEILEARKSKHEGSIRDVILKNIQKDKKILIILSGYGPLLKEKESEIADLLKSDNIQLQLQESHRVKLSNDT